MALFSLWETGVQKHSQDACCSSELAMDRNPSQSISPHFQAFSKDSAPRNILMETYYITITTWISSAAPGCCPAYPPNPVPSTSVNQRAVVWFSFRKGTHTGTSDCLQDRSLCKEDQCFKELEPCLDETCSAPCQMVKCQTLPA